MTQYRNKPYESLNLALLSPKLIFLTLSKKHWNKMLKTSATIAVQGSHIFQEGNR